MTRILQISDAHIVEAPRKVSGFLDTPRLLESAMDRILEGWEKIDPIAAVIATGDIADEGDAACYRIFRRQLDRLPVPCFVIPGNHDLREPMRACFADLGYLPGAGRLNWVHDFTDMRLIGLDSLVEGSGEGLFDAETEEFLIEALQSAQERPVLIAVHHPPFDSGIKFMDAIALKRAEALADVVGKSASPIRILCGHVHSTIIANVGGKTAMSSPALSSTFSTDFRDDAPVGFTTQPGGYMIHELAEGDFRSTAISLATGNGPYPF